MNSWPGMRLVRQRLDGPVLVAVAVAWEDGLVLEATNAGVGDGDAEHVAGGSRARPARRLPRARDDPGFGPKLRWGRTRPGTARRRPGPELAAHELAERLGRDQEGIARRMPLAAVIGDAAAGDQAVDMWMEDKLLCPGVQDGEHADGATDVARVTGEFDDGVRCRFHQQGIAVALVGAQHVPEFPRAR